MPVAWTIKGEAGKALDATTRTLESLAIDSARIDLKSLDTDQLTFSIAPQDVTSATIPELGQTVTLYRDGTKFFHGHVIDNPVSITAGEQSVSVVVAGPWWWLDRINLTSTKTDGTGATAERLSYVFGTTSSGVNLKTAIEALIDRAIVLGAPMQRGSVATFFQVPRITLNQSTCAQALAELVRLVPDTMAAFDYSTSPPTLNITRRGTASVETFTVGSSVIESISIRPVYEMKIERVDLDYVTRDAQGRTQFANQNSGSVTTGRNFRLNISGPELDTFLPNEIFDKYYLKTTPVSTGARDFIVGKDSDCAAAIKKYGYTESTFPVGVGPYTLGSSGKATAKATTYLLEDGTLATTTGKYLILGEDPPDWIEGFTFEKVTIVGEIYYQFAASRSTSGLGATIEYYSLPAWWYDIPWAKSVVAASSEKIGVYTYSYDFFAKPFSINAYLVNATKPQTGNTGTGNTTTQFTMPVGFETSDNYYVGTPVQIGNNTANRYTITAYVGSTRRATISSAFPVAMNGYNFTLYSGAPIYRAADFLFIAPPAGMADELKAAQNFVQYTGNIDLTEQDVGGTSYIGKVINISGSFSAYSTMKALVAGVTMDIKSGQTSIELGTPPRLDYRTFTDRIRRTPQDNIEYL